MANGKHKITPFNPWETRNPNGEERGYIRTTDSLFSTVRRHISPSAWLMYEDMKFVAKGNQKFKYTQSLYDERIGSAKGTYTRNIKILTKMGLIERLPRSWYAPSEFKFSDKWKSLSLLKDL